VVYYNTSLHRTEQMAVMPCRCS